MNKDMALRNRVKTLVDGLKLSPYKFAQEVGISHNTVYRLYNQPDALPDIKVVGKICGRFPGTQPNDVVYYEPDGKTEAT